MFPYSSRNRQLPEQQHKAVWGWPTATPHRYLRGLLQVRHVKVAVFKHPATHLCIRHLHKRSGSRLILNLPVEVREALCAASQTLRTVADDVTPVKACGASALLHCDTDLNPTKATFMGASFAYNANG
jgi:hypothetical protein